MPTVKRNQDKQIHRGAKITEENNSGINDSLETTSSHSKLIETDTPINDTLNGDIGAIRSVLASTCDNDYKK